MTTLTGNKIANTYGGLLKVSSTGVTGTLQNVQDGFGNNASIQLSNSTFNISGAWQLGGSAITANAAAINAITDLSNIQGYVAMSNGNALGREFTTTAPIAITNGTGQVGNSNISLAVSGITSGTYGPMHSLNVDRYGIIVSAQVTASMSVVNLSVTDLWVAQGLTGNYASFTNRVTASGGFYGALTGNVTGNVVGNITGNVTGNVTGDLTGDVTGDLTGNVAGNVSGSRGQFTTFVSGTAVRGVSATFSQKVSAGFYYGDGRHLVNIPSAAGGTLTDITAGNGISITIDGVTSTTAQVSATMAVDSALTITSLTLDGSGDILQVDGNARFNGNVTATAYWGDGSNLTNLPSSSTSVTTFTVNRLTAVSSAVLASATATTLKVNGNVTATGDITANSYYGDGSNLTNLPSAPTSVATFTVNRLTAVSSAVLASATATTLKVNGNVTATGDITANSYYGDGSNLTNLPSAPTSVAAFTVNQLTAVSSAVLASATATTLKVNGNVTATAYWGSGANLTGIVLPPSGTDLNLNNLNVAVKTSTTALAVNAIASVGGDIYVAGGSIEIKTDSGSPANIDLYCETGNAHYARLQAPAHSAFSGNVVATMPVSSTRLAGVSTTDTFINKTFGNQTTFGSGITVGTNVSAIAYWGDGSNLTNVVGATSVAAFTVNQLTVVSSSILASATANTLSGGTAVFTGQVSGVGLTMSGNVTATNYYGNGSNLTGIATTDEIIALAIALG
jgi:hypothetical protein